MQNASRGSAAPTGIACFGVTFTLSRNLSRLCQVLMTPRTAPNAASEKVMVCASIMNCSLTSRAGHHSDAVIFGPASVVTVAGGLKKVGKVALGIASESCFALANWLRSMCTRTTLASGNVVHHASTCVAFRVASLYPWPPSRAEMSGTFPPGARGKTGQSTPGQRSSDQLS
jgi:hypothetical protein